MKLLDRRNRQLELGQRVRIEEDIPSENCMLYKDSIVKISKEYSYNIDTHKNKI